jgi:hypothetical protein
MVSLGYKVTDCIEPFPYMGTSHVNAELKTNISEISSVSIIRVDMVTDIYTGLSNQCLFLLVYYAVGGQSQTVQIPI